MGRCRNRKDFYGRVYSKYLERKYPTKNNKEIRSVLAKSALKSEHQMQNIKTLSGGEQAKIKIAELMLKPSNLLILDDLGAERQSDFALEQVFNVVDSRYKSGKPVIITTNLSLQELKNPSDIKYKRIYDRILEMCVPLQFKGESKRKEKSQAKLNVLKELFKD